MPKLVAIGDSLTQGVQSGAMSKTEYSFPARIAEAMGLDVSLNVSGGFRVPSLPGSGLPLNIEYLLLSLRQHLGTSINWFEWRFELLPLRLPGFIDDIEDYYERGRGARPATYGGVYHNLAVPGFRVRDSFTVTSKYCCEQINRDEGWFEDDFFGLPSASMYRIGQRVLNPKLNPKRKCCTQIDNLASFKENDPVENLILFLGANDCLGTVRDLQIKDMACETEEVPCDPERRRERYNLTSVEDFKADYDRMADEISSAISPDTKVFVATIPHVTIAPITRAIPRDRHAEYKGRRYFSHYGLFFENPEEFDPAVDSHLTMEDVQRIDDRVDAFNEHIKCVAERKGWHVVNICDLLDTLAVKRKDMMSDPGAPLREFLTKCYRADHELLRLNPIPSTLRFETSANRRIGGGLFSLDCFHPTTIGYGLIAQEFLRKMQESEVPDADPARLNWKRIIKQDTLIQEPPVLWDDIIGGLEAHPRLVGLLYKALNK